MICEMARTVKAVEDRREQIIDAAMQAFAQKGFFGATNKDIAREAGITPGLIYHYFKNKEALLWTIVEERSPLHMIRSLPPQVLEQSPEVWLRFLVRQVLLRVEDEKFMQLIRVVLQEVVHNPEMQPMPVTAMKKILDFLSRYLSAKMENGELRPTDPMLTAQVFVGSVMGFVLRRQVLQDPTALQYTQAQIADSVVDTVLTGLLPR
jgi:AcrR family transcriptional regulator